MASLQNYVTTGVRKEAQNCTNTKNETVRTRV